MHFQEWASGDPVIALHPLALESSAFFGVAQLLAAQGLRTLAADLPGFGLTPAPEGPLTARSLAAPVVELARSLETRPLLLGMSLGGRVALEAALMDPDAIRGVVLVAPYLPWRRRRRALRLARWMDPSWAAKIPLERAWPLLKQVAQAIESVPRFEHDWLARASVRVVYYSSCPATRWNLISAAREMAVEPAFGRHGLWTRLAELRSPAVFLWAGRDALIPREHASHVAKTLPTARQIEIPCSGHFVHGAHFRCFEHAVALAVSHALAETQGSRPGAARSLAPCLAELPRSQSRFAEV